MLKLNALFYEASTVSKFGCAPYRVISNNKRLTLPIAYCLFTIRKIISFLIFISHQHKMMTIHLRSSSQYPATLANKRWEGSILICSPFFFALTGSDEWHARVTNDTIFIG